MKKSTWKHAVMAVATVALMGVGLAGEVLANECDQKCVITITPDGTKASCGTVLPGETGSKVCVPINTKDDAYCELELCDDAFGYPIA